MLCFRLLRYTHSRVTKMQHHQQRNISGPVASVHMPFHMNLAVYKCNKPFHFQHVNPYSGIAQEPTHTLKTTRSSCEFCSSSNA